VIPIPTFIPTAVVLGLVSQRGTDPTTERRRLRESESENEDAIARLLDAIFWVSAETFFFGLPTLAWTMLYGDVAVTFVVAVALATLCLVGGMVRARGGARARRRDGESADDAGWPPLTVRLAVLRIAYYNVALVGAVAVGATLVTESVVRVEWATEPVVGPAAVAALVAGLAALLLPRVASLVES
jgi:hypothetical protein